MTNGKLNAFAAVTLAILALPFLVACGDGVQRQLLLPVPSIILAGSPLFLTALLGHSGAVAGHVEIPG